MDVLLYKDCKQTRIDSLRSTCRRAALLLLDFCWITLTCNMKGVTRKAGHAYPSGAPDATSVFFRWSLYC